MAAQAALIADTIAGMKRKLREENRPPTGPDSPSNKPSNRGNKLRENAQYLREGNLGPVAGPAYKERIDYNGYTRYIISRNPPKYDEDGDEILDEAAEEGAEPMEDEDQTPGIEIARILRPLTHPSEIQTHPSLSHIYTSNALPNMIESTTETLRKERKNLAAAKKLLREFIGDAVWIPCGMVESESDWEIFGPARNPRAKTSTTALQPNGAIPAVQVNGDSAAEPAGASTNGTTDPAPTADVEMDDVAPNAPTLTNGHKPEEPAENEDEPTTTNGAATSEEKDPDATMELVDDDDEDKKDADNENDPKADLTSDNEENEDGDGDSPDPPTRRMTTRAQTNQTTNQSPSPPTSPSSSRPRSPINPLYIPNTTHLKPRDLGLPPAEAEDTRRLLWSFVQKQEETVRGYESILENLLKANRLKREVWEACLAEAHVGELSDGEDWVEEGKWGLTEGLRKGVWDEDVQGVETQVGDEGRGKRGRGRRN